MRMRESIPPVIQQSGLKLKALSLPNIVIREDTNINPKPHTRLSTILTDGFAWPLLHRRQIYVTEFSAIQRSVIVLYEVCYFQYLQEWCLLVLFFIHHNLVQYLCVMCCSISHISHYFSWWPCTTDMVKILMSHILIVYLIDMCEHYSSCFLLLTDYWRKE